jgi:carbon-monoxide dehydrogenase medium subunit
VQLISAGGERSVPAADFFLGPLESDVRPEELATEVSFPALPASAGCSFTEVSRRRGDYAICGVAAVIELDGCDAIGRARAAYLSVSGTPLVLDLTEACPDGDFAQAGRLAMAQVRPVSDIHASADYRRHLVGVLTERALLEAFTHARGRVDG